MSDMPFEVQEMLKDLANPIVERCGYILKDWTIVLIQNVAKSPGGSFEFDPDQQRQLVEDSRERIMGIFHTHPMGTTQPSPQDIKGWPPIQGLRYWIVTDRTITEWRRGGDQAIFVEAS